MSLISADNLDATALQTQHSQTRQTATGNSEDIHQLVEQQLPHLRRYARALTQDVDRADDLVQDCVVRALSRLHQFDPATDLRLWMFTILRNLHTDTFRKSTRQGPHIPFSEDVCSTFQLPSQESSLEFKDFCKAFLLLEHTHRQVLVEVAIEGKSYDEVAKDLNIAVGTVKSRLFRARDRLRELGVRNERQRTLS